MGNYRRENLNCIAFMMTGLQSAFRGVPGRNSRDFDQVSGKLRRALLISAVFALAPVGPFAGPARAALVVTPGTGLNASGYLGGPFSGSSQVFTLRNDGTEPLLWTAGKDAAWFSVSANAGALAAGATAEVTVFLNALPLDFAVGSYGATVTFTADGAPTTRPVNLNVVVPSAASVGFGTMSASNRFQLRLTGEAGRAFTVFETATVTGRWATVSTGTLTGGVGTYDFSATNARGFFKASSAGTTAPTLSLVRAVGQNLSQVVVSGSPLGTYLLEASTDGSTWVPVCTNRTAANGTFTYVSSNTNQQYRVSPVSSLPNKPVLDHVLIVGESLARGEDGDPALSTTISSDHFRFYRDDTTTNLAGLYEVVFETIGSGAANHVSANAANRRMLLSNIGANAQRYDLQKKGTPLYALGLSQFEAAPQTVALALYAYRPQALFAVAGENDAYNPDYGLAIRQWQSDYQKDIQRVTGHTGPIPMFHSQISAWTCPTMGSLSTVLSPYQVLAEAEANPDHTILVGPRYVFPYAVTNAAFPGMHPSNEGYRWLGEYYGKVYRKVVVDGQPWSPLKPNTLVRTGAVITVTFHVPVPPLVLDPTLVVNPGHYGFEYWDDSTSPPTITTVEPVGVNQVRITLSATPTAANKRLRYAYTGVPGNPGGPATGPRGNLRDSDPTPSLYGKTLYNWCVHFDKAVD